MLIDTGEYLFRLERSTPAMQTSLQMFYGEGGVDPSASADFRVALRSDSLIRRFYRPQITFYADRQAPFKPVPAAQSFAILEWGMNWCIAAFDYTRLIVHAAVLEKDGRAIIFPAEPGSGKSTLTAFLALSGWNLYSDEMALIDLGCATVSPMFRPICLKNDSIRLVTEWFPQAALTTAVDGTQKGRVAHLQGITRARHRELGKVDIVGVVFPKYRAGSDLEIYTMTQLQGFEKLSSNCFNYNMLGRGGFNTAAKVVESTRQYEIYYSDLAEVAEFLVEEFIAA